VISFNWFIGLENASVKRHCTVGEAVQVGRDMNAYRLILTHFSQRYPSVPALPSGAVDYALLAFDFMRVPFQDLLWAPAIMPALIEAFPPGEIDNDDEPVPFDKQDFSLQAAEEYNTAVNKKKRKPGCECDFVRGNFMPENNNYVALEYVLGPDSKLELKLKVETCEVCIPTEVVRKKKKEQKKKNKRADGIDKTIEIPRISLQQSVHTCVRVSCLF
jgi:hypothetical protein